MASVSEEVLDALDNLDTDELKRFKWRLNESKRYSSPALKKADAPDTVDLMMKRFGQKETVKITVQILRKIKRNDLAEELESNHKQGQAKGSIKDPALVGATSNPMEVTFTNIVPKTRNNFLQYSHQLTLDLNTVNKELSLSEENRVITNTDTEQPYPDHPDRFDVIPQVLCRESVCDRCYWEIEWGDDDDDDDVDDEDGGDDDGGDDDGGDDDDNDDDDDDDDDAHVCISVSYKSINRKGGGDECVFGVNDQSWSLVCSSDSYRFLHSDIETDLTVDPISRKIGVYVDHSEGTLSFYCVYRNTMSLILTIKTTFSQPLYPGFGVFPGSSVKLCDDSE